MVAPDDGISFLPFSHFPSFKTERVFPVDPVEDVTAQCVAFWQVRVVEVCVRIVDHTQLFHDAAGALVLRDGEGDEAGELEGVEGVMEDGAGAFGGEAAAPVVG